MNDTDLDIILAIADGQLTGQAKQDALERIAAEPELGEELAAQISAMDGLKSLEPALMTPSERATLRASLMEQLHLSPAAPAVVSKPQGRPWWQPVLGLASAAALLIAIVAVPSMFSGGDDSSADVVAVAPLATTSAVVEGNARDSDGVSAADPTAPPSTVLVPQIAEEDIQDFFATSPRATVTTVATSSDEEPASGTADEADETSPESSAASAADLFAIAEPFSVSAATLDTCLASLRYVLPEADHIPMAVTLEDDTTVIHFGIDTDDGIVHSVSIDLETCTITSLNP